MPCGECKASSAHHDRAAQDRDSMGAGAKAQMRIVHDRMVAGTLPMSMRTKFAVSLKAGVRLLRFAQFALSRSFRLYRRSNSQV
mmetsp:Transcript_65935/g.117477  ORF Transcript_65935/g.117477 Transcript_65935/m.117477 type:complete len:84 (+) Transcript_65935:220-471(+)